jgi:hypothetical protein
VHTYGKANFFVIFYFAVIARSAAELVYVVYADVVFHLILGDDFATLSASEIADVV